MATQFFGSFFATFPILPQANSHRFTPSFVADVYTELILRFAKSINSASATLFKAKISPWAKGAGKKAAPANGHASEPLEEIDTVGERRRSS